MDRGRFDGSKGEPFPSERCPPLSPSMCLYTPLDSIAWPGLAWPRVVRPVRYGYRREIRRGLITPWALVCPRNSTNGQQRGKLVGYTSPVITVENEEGGRGEGNR